MTEKLERTFFTEYGEDSGRGKTVLGLIKRSISIKKVFG
jgi:hypothetical protein